MTGVLSGHHMKKIECQSAKRIRASWALIVTSPLTIWPLLVTVSNLPLMIVKFETYITLCFTILSVFVSNCIGLTVL